jgi:hypothetical protein
MFDARSLADLDAELGRALADERTRQETYLELIASENYVSPRVLAAQGSLLTNKYADGYPGERHYAGCEQADVAERLAIERAKQLFGAGYANVQPYSGSQANLAAYLALLSPRTVGTARTAPPTTSPVRSTTSFRTTSRPRRASSTTTPSRLWRANIARSSSSPASRRIRASSIGRVFGRLPMTSAPCCWRTSRTSPGSSWPVFIRARLPSPT